MWGNLTLLSSEKKDVAVPALQPGQVGVVSVEFVAPPVEGTYTSHWRLSHKGEQFGPRIWCSIVVASTSSGADCPENGKLVSAFCQKGRSFSKEEVRPSYPEPMQVSSPLPRPAVLFPFFLFCLLFIALSLRSLILLLPIISSYISFSPSTIFHLQRPMLNYLAILGYWFFFLFSF